MKKGTKTALFVIGGLAIAGGLYAFSRSSQAEQLPAPPVTPGPLAPSSGGAAPVVTPSPAVIPPARVPKVGDRLKAVTKTMAYTSANPSSQSQAYNESGDPIGFEAGQYVGVVTAIFPGVYQVQNYSVPDTSRISFYIVAKTYSII